MCHRLSHPKAAKSSNALGKSPRWAGVGRATPTGLCSLTDTVLCLRPEPGSDLVTYANGSISTFHERLGAWGQEGALLKVVQVQQTSPFVGWLPAGETGSGFQHHTASSTQGCAQTSRGSGPEWATTPIKTHQTLFLDRKTKILFLFIYCCTGDSL